MDKCFPLRRVVMPSHDPPWITPLVKYLLRKKKRAADKGHVHKVEDLSSKVYKLIGEQRPLASGKPQTVVCSYAFAVSRFRDFKFQQGVQFSSVQFIFIQAIPIKCFVFHRPVSCDGGLVGRAKKKKTEQNEHLKGSRFQRMPGC